MTCELQLNRFNYRESLRKQSKIFGILVTLDIDVTAYVCFKHG